MARAETTRWWQVRRRAICAVFLLLALPLSGCTEHAAAAHAMAEGTCPEHVRLRAAQSHPSLCRAFAALGVSAEGVAEQYPVLTGQAVGSDGSVARWRVWSGLFVVARISAESEEQERAQLARFASWLAEVPASDLPLLEQAPWALHWLHKDLQRTRRLLGDRGISEHYDAYLESVARLLATQPPLREGEGFRRFARVVGLVSRDDWEKLRREGDLETVVTVLWRAAGTGESDGLTTLRDRLIKIARSAHPLAMDILLVAIYRHLEEESCVLAPMTVSQAASAVEAVLESCSGDSCWAMDVLDEDPSLLGLADETTQSAGVAALAGCRSLEDLQQLCRTRDYRAPILRAIALARSDGERQAACGLWRAVRRSIDDIPLAECLQQLYEDHDARGLLALAGDWHQVDATGAAAFMSVTKPASVCGRVLGRGGEPEAEPGIEDFAPGSDAVRWTTLVGSGQRPSVFETVMAGVDVIGLIATAATAGAGAAPLTSAKSTLFGVVKKAASKVVRRDALKKAERGLGREALRDLSKTGRTRFWEEVRSGLGEFASRTRRDLTRQLKRRFARDGRSTIPLPQKGGARVREALEDTVQRVKDTCRTGAPAVRVACDVGRTSASYGKETAEDVTFGAVLFFLLPRLPADGGDAR